MTKCVFEQLEREGELLRIRVGAFSEAGLLPEVDGTAAVRVIGREAVRAWLCVRNLICEVARDGARLASEAHDPELELAVRGGFQVVRATSMLATGFVVGFMEWEANVSAEQLGEMWCLLRTGAELAREVLRVIEWQKRAGQGALDLNGGQGGERE